MTDFENEFKRRFAEKASSDGLDSEGIWAGIEHGLDAQVAAPQVRSRKWGAAGVVAVIALASAAYIYTTQSSEAESGIVETIKEEQKVGGAYKSVEEQSSRGLTGHAESGTSLSEKENEESRYPKVTQDQTGTEAMTSTIEQASGRTSNREESAEDQSRQTDEYGRNPATPLDAEVSDPSDLLTSTSQSSPQEKNDSDSKGEEQRSSDDAAEGASLRSNENERADVYPTADRGESVEGGFSSDEGIRGNDATLGNTPRPETQNVLGRNEKSNERLNEELSVVLMDRLQPEMLNRAATPDELIGQRILEDMPAHNRLGLLPTEIELSLGVNLLESYYRDDLPRIAIYIPQDLDGATSTIAGRSAAIRGNWHLGEHFRFGLGLEYDGLRSRFDLVTEYGDSLLVTDALIGFETDSSGQQTGVFGVQWAPAMSQRTVRHHNNFEMISIPVFIGLQKEYGPLRLGIDAGLAWTMMRSQSGRTLGVSGGVVDFDSTVEDSRLAFSKTSFLTYQARPYLAYRIADRLSIQAAAQLRAIPFQESPISGVSRGGLIVGFSGGLLFDLK